MPVTPAARWLHARQLEQLAPDPQLRALRLKTCKRRAAEAPPRPARGRQRSRARGGPSTELVRLSIREKCFRSAPRGPPIVAIFFRAASRVSSSLPCFVCKAPFTRDCVMRVINPALRARIGATDRRGGVCSRCRGTNRRLPGQGPVGRSAERRTRGGRHTRAVGTKQVRPGQPAATTSHREAGTPRPPAPPPGAGARGAARGAVVGEGRRRRRRHRRGGDGAACRTRARATLPEQRGSTAATAGRHAAIAGRRERVSEGARGVPRRTWLHRQVVGPDRG